MSKKKLVWVGCTLIGIIILSGICIFVSNSLYKKQAIVYVESIKSEYDAKLKDAEESIEKLKNEVEEISKKNQEANKQTEEKNKEVAKETEKKDNATTQKNESQNNSNHKKETHENNQVKESPDLLKRTRLSNLDKNFWATRLYYMNMALGEAQSSARDMLNNPSYSPSEIKNIISEYVQNLNQNYARFKEVEGLGIPSVCKSDYQKFKSLYSNYIKSYGNMYNEGSKTYINGATYNKCESISNEIGAIFMRMESKLK